jgi:hypothetical protein
MARRNSPGIWSEDWEGREDELAEYKMSEEGRQDLSGVDYSQFDEPDDYDGPDYDEED